MSLEKDFGNLFPKIFFYANAPMTERQSREVGRVQGMQSARKEVHRCGERLAVEGLVC